MTWKCEKCGARVEGRHPGPGWRYVDYYGWEHKCPSERVLDKREPERENHVQDGKQHQR